MSELPIHLVFITFEIFIPHSGSLKSKRKVVRSLKDRLVNKFNASIVEAGYLDQWQRAIIAAAMISTSKRRLDSQVGALRKIFEEEHDIELLKANIEWL